MEDRGKIRNRDWGSQIRDFSGLQFGNITPTDIDGFIDFRNEVFVLIETKYDNTGLPFGQRLALERLADATTKAGKPTIVLIASHHSQGDIDVAHCIVTEYHYKSRWTKDERGMTVKEAIDNFLKKTSTS